VHGLLPGAGSAIALRLLSTLLGLVLLPLGYALLLRYLRFEAATLCWGLFMSPLPAFYAIAGRCYAWALAALLAGLWASLQLLHPHGLPHAARQRAWLVFMLSAVLGLYAVPTHLYGLLGLGLALAVAAPRASCYQFPNPVAGAASAGIHLDAGAAAEPRFGATEFRGLCSFLTSFRARCGSGAFAIGATRRSLPFSARNQARPGIRSAPYRSPRPPSWLCRRTNSAVARNR
jgi:hypothetical protein